MVHRISLFPTGAPNPLPRQSAWVALGALAVAGLLGLSISTLPSLAILPVAAIGVALLVQSARYRVAFFVLGGLFTLQSSDGLSLLKLVYMAGLGGSLVLALLRLPQARTQPWFPALRPLLIASALWMVILPISCVVSLGNYISLSAWLRDILPYVLVAAVPLFACDALLEGSQRWFAGLFIGTGTLSALAFSVAWINRRGFADLPIDHLAMPSLLLPTALLAYAVSNANHSRHAIAWSMLAATVLSLCLITGTRSTFVLLAVPLVVLFAGRIRTINRFARAIGIQTGMLVLLVLLAFVLVQLSGANTELLTDRLASTTDIFSDDVASQSYDERQTQNRLALEAFRSSPIFGVGPGYAFSWLTPTGRPKVSFSPDSPFSVPADLGLIGIVVSVVTIVLYGRTLLRFRGASHHPIHAAARGFVAFFCFWVLLQSPFDDRAVSFGVLFLLILTVSNTGHADLRPPPSTASAPDLLSSSPHYRRLPHLAPPTRSTP